MGFKRFSDNLQQQSNIKFAWYMPSDKIKLHVYIRINHCVIKNHLGNIYNGNYLLSIILEIISTKSNCTKMLHVNFYKWNIRKIDKKVPHIM